MDITPFLIVLLPTHGVFAGISKQGTQELRPRLSRTPFAPSFGCAKYIHIISVGLLQEYYLQLLESNSTSPACGV